MNACESCIGHRSGARASTRPTDDDGSLFYPRRTRPTPPPRTYIIICLTLIYTTGQASRPTDLTAETERPKRMHKLSDDKGPCPLVRPAHAFYVAEARTSERGGAVIAVYNM